MLGPNMAPIALDETNRNVDEDPVLSEVSKVLVTGTRRGDRFAY